MANLPRLGRGVVGAYPRYPERVLQFGGGAFLRGFVDWMIERLNRAGRFGGSVVIVESTGRSGTADLLREQDNLYTVVTRGVSGGKRVDEAEVISCVSRGVDARAQWDEVLALARTPGLRVIVSNTTEAGIVYRAEDRRDERPPGSFPGKLTQVLWERYRSGGEAGAAGFIILPCELIERNGEVLQECVVKTARGWGLPEAFVAWVGRGNEWCNTLVDRIVTGFPKDEAGTLGERLGYEDKLLDATEVFHFLAVEGSEVARRELPFEEVGLDVVWAKDIGPYRERKVRILNGGHTMTVLAAYLAGKDTVGECVGDPVIRRFMERGLAEEIIPTLDGKGMSLGEIEKFAGDVMERFGNPFIRHMLLSIAMNSTSKFKVRVLPTIKDYARLNGGKLPRRLVFSLAALIRFYRGYEMRDGALVGRRGSEEYKIQDTPQALEVFRRAWEQWEPVDTVRTVLSASEIWGEDLTRMPGLVEAVHMSLLAVHDGHGWWEGFEWAEG